MSERTSEGLVEAINEEVVGAIQPDADGVNRVRGDLVARAIVEYGEVDSTWVTVITENALEHEEYGDAERARICEAVAFFLSLLLEASKETER